MTLAEAIRFVKWITFIRSSAFLRLHSGGRSIQLGINWLLASFNIPCCSLSIWQHRY